MPSLSDFTPENICKQYSNYDSSSGIKKTTLGNITHIQFTTTQNKFTTGESMAGTTVGATVGAAVGAAIGLLGGPIGSLYGGWLGAHAFTGPLVYMTQAKEHSVHNKYFDTNTGAFLSNDQSEAEQIQQREETRRQAELAKQREEVRQKQLAKQQEEARRQAEV